MAPKLLLMGEQRSCSPSCRILNRFASDRSRISHKNTGSQIWQMTRNTETSKCAIVASEKRRRQPKSTPQEESDTEGHGDKERAQRRRKKTTTQRTKIAHADVFYGQIICPRLVLFCPASKQKSLQNSRSPPPTFLRSASLPVTSFAPGTKKKPEKLFPPPRPPVTVSESAPD